MKTFVGQSAVPQGHFAVYRHKQRGDTVDVPVIAVVSFQYDQDGEFEVDHEYILADVVEGPLLQSTFEKIYKDTLKHESFVRPS